MDITGATKLETAVRMKVAPMTLTAVLKGKKTQPSTRHKVDAFLKKEGIRAA